MLRVIVFINNPISTAIAATAIKNNYIEGKVALKVWVFLVDKHKYINDFERLISNESGAIYKKD